ncbi:uncharacterized protein SPSK_06730 [Sporothrix schenckii 1099-18]|uniref:Uncharacterized protein n=1 Tax=Sporothrix schenckii 1099-18 TaxID=1397361 RepID=A0A0F2MLL8_SPOSC|nr:uncharacterized protein SPSK_06730 [Sporothrix schenckii 1099-18]KJR89081.1 hypothetical protein SPSK_06730 [Sporothrix schenckii 1099-18]
MVQAAAPRSEKRLPTAWHRPVLRQLTDWRKDGTEMDKQKAGLLLLAEGSPLYCVRATRKRYSALVMMARNRWLAGWGARLRNAWGPEAAGREEWKRALPRKCSRVAKRRMKGTESSPIETRFGCQEEDEEHRVESD